MSSFTQKLKNAQGFFSDQYFSSLRLSKKPFDSSMMTYGGFIVNENEKSVIINGPICRLGPHDFSESGITQRSIDCAKGDNWANSFQKTVTSLKSYASFILWCPQNESIEDQEEIARMDMLHKTNPLNTIDGAFLKVRNQDPSIFEMDAKKSQGDPQISRDQYSFVKSSPVLFDTIFNLVCEKFPEYGRPGEKEKFSGNQFIGKVETVRGERKFTYDDYPEHSVIHTVRSNWNLKDKNLKKNIVLPQEVVANEEKLLEFLESVATRTYVTIMAGDTKIDPADFKDDIEINDYVRPSFKIWVYLTSKGSGFRFVLTQVDLVCKGVSVAQKIQAPPETPISEKYIPKRVREELEKEEKRKKQKLEEEMKQKLEKKRLEEEKKQKIEEEKKSEEKNGEEIDESLFV